MLTISFISNGVEVDSQEVAEGSKATAPADPTMDHFTFTGWDKTLDTIIIEDTTFTAEWTETDPSHDYRLVTGSPWSLDIDFNEKYTFFDDGTVEKSIFESLGGTTTIETLNWTSINDNVEIGGYIYSINFDDQTLTFNE